EMMQLGVESMMLSPGYSYDKAPDQKHFLGRARIKRLFRAILSNRKQNWRFNQSPLFLEFLMGKQHYTCTPWGMPTFNIFGWQKPCYLLQDGYADTFKELMESTEWQYYGTGSGTMMGETAMNDSANFEQPSLTPAANPEALEVAPGTRHEKLEGWIPELAREDDVRQALEKAFDYRGDVSITRKDGSKLEGYIFD